MKNESSRLIARAGPLALAVLTINVLLALPADAETQVARYSVADQEVRAVESQLSLALSSVDVDQLSRLWADDFASTMDDGHIVGLHTRGLLVIVGAEAIFLHGNHGVLLSSSLDR
jgi:hypothetical protein